MTNPPDDRIDPYEPRLARRVGTFADRAVRPIDPLTVATAARVGARRSTLVGRLFGSTPAMARLGVVLAGGLIAVAAFGVWLGTGGQPIATQSTSGPEATPTSLPGSVDACAAIELAGTITAWEGAAGHRIATIQLTNSGSADCSIPELLRPALVDADGHALIVGAPAKASSAFTLAAGRYATTLVDMANYCGQAPTAALRIRLYLPSQDSVEAGAAAGLPNPVDAPPCNGSNVPSTIEMQPLQP